MPTNSTLTAILIILPILATLWFKREEWFSKKTWIQKKRGVNKATPPIDPANNNKPTEETKKSWWKRESWVSWHTDRGRILITVAVLLIANFMLKTMTSTVPEIWNWYTGVNDGWFFVGFNLSWVAVAFLAFKKDETNKPVPEGQFASRFIAWAIMIFTLINLGGYIFRGMVEAKQIGLPMTISIPATPLWDIPAVVALPVIADCESGDGSPESGKQFNEDGTVVTNPKNLGAIGKYQINTSDPSIATLLKKNGWDAKTLEGNEAAAQYLFLRRGTRDWNASRGCWESKLGVMQSESLFTTEHIAPVGAIGVFGSRIGPLPDRFNIAWKGEGVFEIRNNLGKTAVFDSSKEKNPDLPSPTEALEFRSLTDKPTKVILTWKRIPSRVAN